MLEFIVIVICLLVNAIFSCIEMAFVTVGKPRLRKLAAEGDHLAKRLLDLRSNPERVLSVLQIGITLVGAISAAVGGAGAEESLSPVFQKYFDISEELAESFAILSVVIPITYFSVVIGELVPKTLALKYPLRFAKLGALFLVPLDKFFSPVVFLLEISTKLIINPLIRKLKSESVTDQAASVDLDSLPESHKQYVMNLIQVDKRKVKDILVPWEIVTKIDKSFHQSDIMRTIRESRHTRMPVINNGVPIGLLHSKEFISEIEIAKMDWHSLIHPILKLNSEEPIMSALKILQSKSSHMAIVYKKAEVIGLVTLEDIFEEFIGEMYDEDDNPTALLSTNSKLRTLNLNKK